MAGIDPFEIPFMIHAAERRLAGDDIAADRLIEILKARRRLGDYSQSPIEATSETEASDYGAETIEYLRAYNRAGMEMRDNPLFAWGEIFLLPKDAPLPSWVREYLREVAIALFEITADEEITPTSAAHKIPAALRLVRAASEKFNAFADVRACNKKLSAALEVISQSGKRESAVAKIAITLGKEPRSIFRWLSEVGRHSQKAESLLSRDRPPK